MNPLEILDVLLIIFDMGSDLDLDDHLDRLPDFPRGFSYPRTLKPFFRSAAQVNKQWRDLLHTIPSFWVTKIYFYRDSQSIARGVHPASPNSLFSREQYAWAEELLSGSDNSDIDISWYLHDDRIDEQSLEYCKDFLEFQHWMDANVYPISHRVRQFSASGFLVDLHKSFFKSLFESTILHAWPRLRIFKFEPCASIEASQMPNAPVLRLATFDAFYWADHQFPLANSNLSTLHVAHNSHEARSEGASIMTYFTPSLLSSLTEMCLNLSCNSLDREETAFRNIPDELHLPCLEKLALYMDTPEHIWRIVGRLCAPLLAHLITTCMTQAEIEEGIPNKLPEPKFPRLENLEIAFMTHSWASIFIRTVPASNNQLSTLRLDFLEEFQIGGTAPQENEPMEFAQKCVVLQHFQNTLGNRAC
jgi:hypothetical protein